MLRGARVLRLCVVLVALALVQPAWGGASYAATPAPRAAKVEPDLLTLATANPSRNFHVIVRSVNKSTAAGKPLEDHERAKRAGHAVQRAAGTPARPLGIVGGASAVLSGKALLKLAADPGVESIVDDVPFRAAFDPVVGAPLVTTADMLDVGAPSAWTQYGVTGRGVGVAVLDSGVYGHPDLSNRVVAVDFTSATAPATATTAASTTPLGDPGGHGTHVAGLIAGDGTSSAGVYTGVAPNAQIVDVRVLGANGSSSLSTVLQGMQWVLVNRNTYNIRVVNLSFGATPRTSYTQDLLATAVEKLYFAGMVVVVAAGNAGPYAGTIATPADDPYVITVGAVDDAGIPSPSSSTLTVWSSVGPTAYDSLAKPDLAAPGRHLVSLRSPGSTLDTLFPERVVATNYFLLSGTSMSAPVVAGVAALMLERNPTLTPRQVKSRLRRTATPLAYGSQMTTGAGMVNALAAVGSVDTTAQYSSRRVADGFANDEYAYLYGGRQPFVWRDLEYHNGVDSHGVRWTDITWDNVTWDPVTWDNVTWEAFTWTDITWDNVSWENVTWDLASVLDVTWDMSNDSSYFWVEVD